MKPKIVVLGGGMGSMAAVWELSSRPEIPRGARVLHRAVRPGRRHVSGLVLGLFSFVAGKLVKKAG